MRLRIPHAVVVFPGLGPIVLHHILSVARLDYVLRTVNETCRGIL